MRFNFLGYNYKRFWDSRSQIPEEAYQFKDFHLALFESVKKLKPKSLIEIGCGYGKNLVEFEKMNIPLIYGMDISKKRLSLCKTKNATLIEASIVDFKCNRKFEAVLSINCLMHIKPKDIKKAVTNVINLSEKHIILLERYVETEPLCHPNGYIFNHDYEKLFELPLVEKQQFGEQLLLLFDNSPKQ